MTVKLQSYVLFPLLIKIRYIIGTSIVSNLSTKIYKYQYVVSINLFQKIKKLLTNLIKLIAMNMFDTSIVYRFASDVIIILAILLALTFDFHSRSNALYQLFHLTKFTTRVISGKCLLKFPISTHMCSIRIHDMYSMSKKSKHLHIHKYLYMIHYGQQHTYMDSVLFVGLLSLI